MSHQCIADAFAPAIAEYRSQVLKATWGHLAPSKNMAYYGHITFAVGIFGSDDLNPTALECEFANRDGESLDSSPWFYDAIMELMQSLKCEAGGVYHFEGSFCNYEFKGKYRRLQLSVVSAGKSVRVQTL